MAHWTINHSSYTGSVTVGATPLSKNTSTSSINQTATFTLGSHNKTVSLTHTGAANALHLYDGDLTDDWFAYMCHYSYLAHNQTSVGGGAPNNDFDTKAKKEAFWDVTSFPTISNFTTSNPSDIKIENQEFNPIPKSEAYAVMDKTDDGHKETAPRWKFHLHEVYLDTAGKRKRILHGATVLNAEENFKMYSEAWTAYVEYNNSGHFTAVDILYEDNNTGALSAFTNKSYRIEFPSAQDSLYFDVTPSQVEIKGHNGESFFTWEFGDVNCGDSLTASGAYSQQYANLYVPCVIDGLAKRINQVELTVS